MSTSDILKVIVSNISEDTVQAALLYLLFKVLFEMIYPLLGSTCFLMQLEKHCYYFFENIGADLRMDPRTENKISLFHMAQAFMGVPDFGRQDYTKCKFS